MRQDGRGVSNMSVNASAAARNDARSWAVPRSCRHHRGVTRAAPPGAGLLVSAAPCGGWCRQRRDDAAEAGQLAQPRLASPGQ